MCEQSDYIQNLHGLLAEHLDRLQKQGFDCNSESFQQSVLNITEEMGKAIEAFRVQQSELAVESTEKLLKECINFALRAYSLADKTGITQ